ncbi:MAG: phosphotyrosine protein phosphatase [Candidatus Bathyarchaeia archaeon]
MLFVCTGNMERSPTAEELFRNEDGLEVKSAGISPSAPKFLTESLVAWADKIFVMEEVHKEYIAKKCPWAIHKVVVLGIPDIYFRNDPELKRLLRERVSPHLRSAR